MTVASDEATAARDDPVRPWKCPGCGIRLDLAATLEPRHHITNVHANDPERETWLKAGEDAIGDWLWGPSPEHDAAADTQPPSSEAEASTSATTPSTRDQVLATIAANRSKREAGQRARAELPRLLARGRRIPGLTITEMARAAGISRQTAHELVREAGDVG
jgi:hypothetical protein